MYDVETEDTEVMFQRYWNSMSFKRYIVLNKLVSVQFESKQHHDRVQTIKKNVILCQVILDWQKECGFSWILTKRNTALNSNALTPTSKSAGTIIKITK